MVQQYEDAAQEFNAGLMGQSGPPFWSFGRGRPPIGMYIEGHVVAMRSRNSQKYQTDAERARGDQPEWEYWVGSKKRTSVKPYEQFVLEEPQAKPIKQFLVTLQTNLRNHGEKDDGRRVFQLPREVKANLAEALRAKGMDGGLELGTFLRVTLTELEQLPDLDTPKRHYRVDVWSAAEQPSPSPVQPVDPRGDVNAPKEKQSTPQVVQQYAQQPQQQAPVAQAQPQFQAPAAYAFPDNMLAMLKQQGQPCPPGNEERWAQL